MTKKKKREITINSPETRILLGFLFLITGIAITASPFVKDASVMEMITSIFGFSALAWGLTIVFFSARFFTDKSYFRNIRTLLGFILASFAASVFFSYWIPKDQLETASDLSRFGGTFGKTLHIALADAVGGLIEIIIVIIVAIVAFSLISGIRLELITNWIIRFFEKIKERADEKKQSKDQQGDAVIIDDSTSITKDNEYIGITKSKDDQIHIEDGNKKLFDDDHSADISGRISSPDIDDRTITSDDGQEEDIFKPRFPNWEFPSLDLLSEPIMQPQDKEIHKHNAVVIEKTLRSFDIESKVNKITIGPTIVQYALSITIGTKVAKVKNLTNDLALALATSESQIRVEAPIPGTSLIGIEIPNPTPNFVYIKDMVRELKQEQDRYELPLILGKNVSGKSMIKDLSKLPHLLVAGATGTGKSVGINSIITGLLMTKTPDELRLILVDPKMVEMAPYNGLPHLLVPVITDMELVVNALQWAVEEMTTRYRILKQNGTKNIVEYNNKCSDSKLPYIVIIIDEMADLMLTTGVDVESRVVRLTQMARAVGIHLILATQRPDVNIITGIIKANVPGRMAFSVSSQIDSRVIIDQSGAETLIGMGDMLFKSPELNKPVRLQGAFTSTKDTESLVSFLKSEISEDISIPSVTRPEPKITQGGVVGMGAISDDPLFENAMDVVINTQKGSASMLQRRLKIGYNRAARLIDIFEDLGIVGPQDGSNPRNVLINSKEDFIRRYNQRGGDDGGDEQI